MHKRSLKLFSLVLVICLIVSGLNAWTGNQRLTWTAGDTTSPSLAIDSNDIIHVLFQDETFGYPTNEIYHKASTNGGLNWTPLNRMTWNSGDSLYPDIAIGPNNYLHVVWQDDNTGNIEIYYKQSQNSGSSWGGTKRLTWNPHSSRSPRIAVGANGHIHVVWYEYTASYDKDIYYKRSTDNGVTWSPTQRLTWSTESSSPVIGIDSNGKVHIFFHGTLVATTWATEIFYKNSKDGGSTWSLKKRITWNGTIEWDSNIIRSIAINANNIHLAWRYLYYRIVWSNKSNIYYKNSADGGATWGATKQLTWTGGQVDPDPVLIGNPSIAVDSLNNPHVSWDFIISGDKEIIYKKSTNGGVNWGPNQRLTWNSGASTTPKIATDSSNNVHVVWADETPGNYEIYYKKD